MSPFRRAAPLWSAFIIGACAGTTALISATMLVYYAPRLLVTIGLIIGLLLLAVATGVWVGGTAAHSRRRWVMLLMAYLAAGVYATLWSTQPSLRETALGGALAALFLVAQPAYAAGALLATMHLRPAAVAAALAGAALGVALTAASLIPRLDVDVIFFAQVTVLLVTRLWYESAAVLPQTDHARAPMTGKTVLVTGVGDAGQLGFALAQRMVAAGARTICVDRHDHAAALARQLGDERTAIGLRADLTDDAAVDAIFADVRGRFGRLDAVINAAGGLSTIRTIAETDHAEWQREIARNADTAFLVSRAALPLLRESRGCIVNFASPAGLRARASLGAYSAGKAAVIALTRALALEEKANGVRVNAVAPGMIDTEQNRQSAERPEEVRWVTREQVADAVIFLCSDASSGISGETIHVLGEGVE